MGFNSPESASEVDARLKTDIRAEVTGSNPFLPNSFLGAMATAIANRIFDFYFSLEQVALESIPDTAIDQMERWAAIWNVNRTAGSVAKGRIIVEGLASTVIPQGTVYLASNDLEYETDSLRTITSQVLAVTLTFAGGVVTATTAADHRLASGQTATIAGAVESDYNGAFAITVTSETTFTYSITGTPTTPATGSISATHVSASIEITSDLSGESENQLVGARLDVQTPIAGAVDFGIVDFDEIAGGTNQETTENLRLRYLDRLQKPVAHFNVAEITALAKTVNGVTRVFVQEITPAVGQVTIYFMRDNDDNVIPSPLEVAEVKALIDTIVPVNTDLDDVFVLAPSPQSENFTFSALTPDTPSMREAIESNLEQFFQENTTVGVNVDEDAYRSAIFNTVDVSTGDQVSSFNLSNPSGDLTIASGEIATLGAVTFT